MGKRRLLVVAISFATVAAFAIPALATFTPGFYTNKGATLWDDAGDGIVTGGFLCTGTGFKSGDPYPYQGITNSTYGGLVNQSNARDMTYQLARHTISAQLNIAFGACNAVWGDEMAGLVAKANTFLAAHNVGSNPQGSLRSHADALKTCLDLHNNIPDGFTADNYLMSAAKACANSLLP